ncbi:ATP phosphoribosyltransferase regulatory subunit [Shouchella shacheensis]|uniref:ATP phosphoribosyltransferase regulatory subunit n=1 Tax=Shouchella shacheensis TaxID=1649580 RepID=UPI000AD9D11D|nr:ATP phosphoribosyltransferase regulatory subunit [Shouchella shacheensis]
MAKPFMFEKPLGMRDTLPALYKMQEAISKKMLAELESWGYERVQTPSLEYYETVGEASAILDTQLFKLIDNHGKTLVLRPDMTAPIARLVASSMRAVPYPVRLAYQSTVFRAQQVEGGKPAEFEQIGVELIGDPTVSAEAESVALLSSALKKGGLERFQVAIGHVGFLEALLTEIVGNEERAETLRRYLYEKNYVGFREHVKSLGLSSIDKGRLMRLLKLRGGVEVLEGAKELTESRAGKAAIASLRELSEALEAHGLREAVQFDLTLVLHMSYYTGSVFEVYGEALGVPLGGGGRYDELLSKFERSGSATGFGIRLDLLAEAIGREPEAKPRVCLVFSKERRAEAIAVAKEHRERGKTVVLQDLSGIASIDEMTGVYDDVIYCIGQTKGGGETDA